MPNDSVQICTLPTNCPKKLVAKGGGGELFWLPVERQ